LVSLVWPAKNIVEPACSTGASEVSFLTFQARQLNRQSPSSRWFSDRRMISAPPDLCVSVRTSVPTYRNLPVDDILLKSKNEFLMPNMLGLSVRSHGWPGPRTSDWLANIRSVSAFCLVGFGLL
jgi:hypothetical protein